MGGEGSGWRKSSYSDTDNCVEVKLLLGHALVRDSKNRRAVVLDFSVPEWRAFLDGVRSGEFDPVHHDPRR
ncbi:DUF397 domain-containing protein [Pseudonocardia humida]|uniref:DUF397 domain-containing protein n=1 Tax=Pseudonocardia humida TaxID=2800819 RepID=UPI0027E29191|nr:DUF397 domain-containing protein [Pseudonocardia humida]